MEEKLYRMSEISEKYGLPVSTLRYYGNIGLLDLPRDGQGRRVFDSNAVDRLELILCASTCGFSLGDIRHIFELAAGGDATLAERRQMFLRQRELLEQKRRRISDQIAYVDQKLRLMDDMLRERQ